eukprot:scaffold6830_cov202-Prasinococcus_capsulatus_cf.AAC.1
MERPLLLPWHLVSFPAVLVTSSPLLRSRDPNCRLGEHVFITGLTGIASALCGGCAIDRHRPRRAAALPRPVSTSNVARAMMGWQS